MKLNKQMIDKFLKVQETIEERIEFITKLKYNSYPDNIEYYDNYIALIYREYIGGGYVTGVKYITYDELLLCDDELIEKFNKEKEKPRIVAEEKRRLEIQKRKDAEEAKEKTNYLRLKNKYEN